MDQYKPKLNLLNTLLCKSYKTKFYYNEFSSSGIVTHEMTDTAYLTLSILNKEYIKMGPDYILISVPTVGNFTEMTQETTKYK